MALNFEGDQFRFLADILILAPEVLSLFSSEGITSDILVGFSGSSKTETLRCSFLNGESEGIESNICCGKLLDGSKGCMVWKSIRFDNLKRKIYLIRI